MMQAYNKKKQIVEQVLPIGYPLLRLAISNYLRGTWIYIFLCLNNIQVVDEIYRKPPKIQR